MKLNILKNLLTMTSSLMKKQNKIREDDIPKNQRDLSKNIINIS